MTADPFVPFESVTSDKGPPARWSPDDVIGLPRVMSVLEENLDRVVDELRDAGWLVYRLPADIRDAAAFFEATSTFIPLRSPYRAGDEVIWDAVADLLSWGLYEESDSDRIAIVWPTPREGASPELEEAMSVFWQVADSLSKPEFTCDSPKQVLVLTTGHIAIAQYDEDSSSARPDLTLHGEITPTRFGEVGRPYVLRRRDDDRMVALCSAFDPLHWPGRTISAGHVLRNRLSLYAGDFEHRVAVFDAARLPINDVAFHPTEPWLAVGTGSYDGGHVFEGDLYLWNWKTGEYRSLLAESREVVCCRFLDHDRVAVLLRPRDEEEYAGANAFTIFVSAVIDLRADAPAPRLVDLEPIDPAGLGFHVPPAGPATLSQEDHQHLAGLGFEERHRVWDVAWLDSERIAAVHDGCHVEVWRLPDHREATVQGAGHGVQLLRQSDALLVHVLERGDYVARRPASSTLFALRGNSFAAWHTFESACSFSADRQGRILARGTGDLFRTRTRHDRVLDPSGQVILDTDLGHYDSFNHYVRLDDGDELYFLRGSSPSSHEEKRLCGIDSTGTIHERMAWDGHREHMSEGCSTLVARDSIARAYRGYVELCSLSDGRALWRCDVGLGATAMVTTSDARHVIVALTDGRLGVIDASDGRLVQDLRVVADGVPTVATALAMHDRRLLVGTIDGRLLLYGPSTFERAADVSGSPEESHR